MINQSTFKFSALVESLQAQVGALLSFFWASLPDAMGLSFPIQTKMTYTTKQNLIISTCIIILVDSDFGVQSSPLQATLNQNLKIPHLACPPPTATPAAHDPEGPPTPRTSSSFPISNQHQFNKWQSEHFTTPFHTFEPKTNYKKLAAS